MEIKINREIRDFAESIYFGLSIRQFIFSAFAVIVAVLVYMFTKPNLGTETASWICILCAAPFAALGFFKYNGLTAEQFIWAWFKSEFLMPREICFKPQNIHYEMMKETIVEREREGLLEGSKKSDERRNRGD